MADIRRIDVTEGPGPRMSRCVVRGDNVYLCGLTAADTSQDIKGQTAQILERIDHYLREAGTNKSNLLTANLWIKDMAMFRDMNSVWNEWVDPKNPPARACVRADLARPEVLVVIMVTAVKSRDRNSLIFILRGGLVPAIHVSFRFSDQRRGRPEQVRARVPSEAKNLSTSN